MPKSEVRCKVLGHNDGPVCDECGENMDSVRIESKRSKYYGCEAYYCYPCTFEKE